MKTRYLICHLVAFFLSSHLSAQISPLGTEQNPPGIAWKEIETKHFRVVFPEEITQDAQRVATTLEYLYEPVSHSLKKKPHRITVILHNQNIISNGFVTLAPRRSEWYNTPPQTAFTGTNDWYNLLSVHEFRHVVQFDKMNRGLIALMYGLFGETGTLAASFLSVPSWYWEGDATGTETALTQSGRGRLPSFNMPMRTMLLRGPQQNYYQMLLGSYKNYFGGAYEMGYYMTSYVKRQHGSDMWSDILRRNSNFPFFYTFSWAMKAKTGNGAPNTFENMSQELKDLWSTQEPSYKSDLTTIEVRYDNGFMNPFQNNPKTLTDGSVVFFDYNLGEAPGIKIKTTDGAISHITRSTWSGNFSASQNKVIWVDPDWDLRWGLKNGSRVVVWDATTRNTQTLLTNTRLTYVAMSADGQKFAAVEHSRSNKSSIILFDTQTGNIIKKLSNPNNDVIINPSWSSDNKHIVYVRQTLHDGKGVTLIDIENDATTDVLPAQHTMNYTNPVIWNDWILLNAHFDGVDNIFAFHKYERTWKQITHSSLGAFNPFVSAGNRLVFDEYTVDGYIANSLLLDTNRWTNVDIQSRKNDGYYEPLLQQELGTIRFDSITPGTFAVKKYNSLSDLINIHSWSPTLNPRQYGVSVFSQNIMSTTRLSASYNYDRNEKTSGGEVGASYGGFYPIADVTAKLGSRASTYTVTTIKNGKKTEKLKWYGWNEKSLSAALRLPLNFSSQGWQRYFSASAGFSYTKVSDQKISFAFDQNNGVLQSIFLSGFYYNATQPAAYVYPQWGQRIWITYSKAPFKDHYNGSQFFAQGDLFFPGLLKRHSGWIQGQFERQKTGANYRYASWMIFPRGYSYIYHDAIKKLGATYTVPLMYPDTDFLAMFYIKRIYGDVFGDYGVGQDYSGPNVKTKYRSAGAGGYANMHFFTLPVEFSVGYRYAYAFDKKNTENNKHAQPQIVIALTGQF
ncbi:MAG TPA: hypothetical protein PLA15_01455 [bacterium]|nr:hypothetical protein [bacterium]HMZ03191.1 hypothetical protein [bacterium]